MADKPTIGLTGGIAVGQERGLARARAPGRRHRRRRRLAREVVQKGSAGLAEIVREFGAGVLDADGALDRQKLAAIVFGDEEARKKLQAITHPRIGR